MARNRKYRSTVVRYGPVAKAAVACVLIGGAGIGYVWQKDQIARLGQQIKSNESRLAGLRDQNEKLRQSLATLQTPGYLETQIREWKLGLVPPQETQVWRLIEPAAEAGPAG